MVGGERGRVTKFGLKAWGPNAGGVPRGGRVPVVTDWSLRRSDSGGERNRVLGYLICFYIKVRFCGCTRRMPVAGETQRTREVDTVGWEGKRKKKSETNSNFIVKNYMSVTIRQQQPILVIKFGVGEGLAYSGMIFDSSIRWLVQEPIRAGSPHLLVQVPWGMFSHTPLCDLTNFYHFFAGKPLWCVRKHHPWHLYSSTHAAGLKSEGPILD